MNPTFPPASPPPSAGAARCRSCGAALPRPTRKYCSVACRQDLRHTLDIRTGLLRALNTRFATFYFTDTVIVLDVWPDGGDELFSFIFPRAADDTPATAFRRLADRLGQAWWQTKNRTRKTYLANRQVLAQARRNPTPASAGPQELQIPTVKGANLVALHLQRADLAAPDLQARIKQAFRRQAKRHHPDLGGDSAMFRKIHAAYRDMNAWACDPTFVRRRGFPDKWFYDGATRRWVQPTPGQASF